MRLTRIVLLLSVASLVLTSCASNGNLTNSPAADSMVSIENIPPFEKFSSMPIDERFRIKMQLEEIPITSCSTHYEKLIQDFLQEEELFDLYNIAIEQDNLSVIPGKNNKSLLNLILRIDLKVDRIKILENWDIVADVASQIGVYLHDDTFYALKVKQCIISTYDLNGYLIRTSEHRASVLDESIFREQSESEYAAQSIAYEYSQENSEFILEKFGALSETRELYVEYYVKDSYFGFGEDENRKHIDNLESVAGGIKDYLLKESAVNGYIAENNLKILTISFRNGILEDFYLVFNYKL